MLPMRRLQKGRAAIGESPYHDQVTKTTVLWSCLKVFWFSKDNSTGHSKWKIRKGRQKKRLEDNIKELTWMGFASSPWAAEDRTSWEEVVAKSSEVPQ